MPISESRLHTILSGEIPDLEALQNPEDGDIFVVDIDVGSDSILQTIVTETDSLPDDMLPSPEVRLNVPIPDEISDFPSRERAHLLNIKLESDLSDESGRVGVIVLGQAMSTVQRLVDAIGQAKLGDPTSRGSIPDSILQQTRLDPVSAYAGSFGIRLESNKDDDLLGESLVRSSLQGLFELLDAGDQVAELTAQLSEMRSRVAKNYSDFLTIIEGSLGSASLSWSQPGRAQLRQSQISQEKARNIIAQMESVNAQIQEEFTVQGILIGGNTRTLRFEIEATAGGERFEGTIDGSATSDVDLFPLNAPCQATLQPHLEINEVTGEERTTYTLLGIQRV